MQVAIQLAARGLDQSVRRQAAESRIMQAEPKAHGPGPLGRACAPRRAPPPPARPSFQPAQLDGCHSSDVRCAVHLVAHLAGNHVGALQAAAKRSNKHNRTNYQQTGAASQPPTCGPSTSSCGPSTSSCCPPPAAGLLPAVTGCHRLQSGNQKAAGSSEKAHLRPQHPLLPPHQLPDAPLPPPLDLPPAPPPPHGPRF